MFIFWLGWMGFSAAQTYEILDLQLQDYLEYLWAEGEGKIGGIVCPSDGPSNYPRANSPGGLMDVQDHDGNSWACPHDL